MMFCKNCGAEIKDGIFCPNCGTNNADQVENTQPSFGTKNETPQQTGSGVGEKLKNVPQQKILLGIVAIIVVLLLILILVSAIGGRGSNTAKGAVKDYWKALEKQSTSKILDCVPKDYQKDLLDAADISKKELKQGIEDVFDEEDFDEIGDIEVTIRDVEKEDDDELEDWVDLYDLYYGDVFDKFDITKIRKISTVTVKYKIKDTDGDTIYSDTEDMTVFKYKGDWYCSEALDFIGDSADEVA